MASRKHTIKRLKKIFEVQIQSNKPITQKMLDFIEGKPFKKNKPSNNWKGNRKSLYTKFKVKDILLAFLVDGKKYLISTKELKHFKNDYTFVEYSKGHPKNYMPIFERRENDNG